MTDWAVSKISIAQMKIRHIVAAFVIIALTAGLSFYLPDGYQDLGNHKYHAFIWVTTIGLLVWITAAIADLIRNVRAESIKIKIDRMRNQSFGWMNISVCLLGVSAVISTLTSNYRIVSIWGNDGWNMGLITIILMIGLYCIALDLFFNADCFVSYLPVAGGLFISLGVFILGILNRYSIYPIEIYGRHEDYISTLGNINWYCGYWCIWMAIGCGIYLESEKSICRLLSGIYIIVASIAGITCGASSAYLAIGAIIAGALLICCINQNRMQAFGEMVFLIACSLPCIRLIGLFRVNRMWYDSEILRIWSFSNQGIVVWICVSLVCIPCIIIGRRRGTACLGVERGIRLRGFIIGILAGSMAAFIIVLALNSLISGGIWPVRGIAIFTVNDSWGNGRGFIWRVSLDIIKNTPFIRHIFGAGCDCFCSYAYNIESVSLELQRKFAPVVLTNAHNEMLTMFINQGILGLTSYIIWFGSHIIAAFKCSDSKINMQDGDSDNMSGIGLFSLILAAFAYLSVGLVGFMQILSTPFIFIAMGAAAGLIKKNTLNIMN